MLLPGAGRTTEALVVGTGCSLPGELSPTAPALTGLSGEQAAVRLQAEGPNELPAARPRSGIAIAADVVREPILILLVAAGFLYLLLGDVTEALALLGGSSSSWVSPSTRSARPSGRWRPSGT
jgi:hypothetical protein